MAKASWWDLARRYWDAGRTGQDARPSIAGSKRDRGRTGPTDAALLALAKLALASDDATPILQAACGHALACCGADRAAVVLLEPGNGEICRVAATAGGSNDAVGQRFGLPLDRHGATVQPPGPGGHAGEGWVAPPQLAATGLGGGADFWVPIGINRCVAGWLIVQARTADAFDVAAGASLAELAGLLASVVQRERQLLDNRRQAQRARDLYDELPVLWLAIDSHDDTIVGCGRWFAAWLGRATADCLGLPATALLAAPAGAADLASLRLPLRSGAEAGAPFRLRHSDGSVRDCVADGTVTDDFGPAADGAPTLLWVFRERPALPDAGAGHGGGLPGDDFEWALEAERERRQESLRLLAPLQQALHGLQACFDDSRTELAGDAPGRLPPPERPRAALALAWQAWEAAAATLDAPAQRATDLLSALEALVRQTAERSGTACSFECRGPVSGLPDRARLAVYRASRELLLQSVATPASGGITLQLQTTPSGALLVRLLRRPPGDSAAGRTLAPPAEAAQRRGLGSFGVHMLLAGVGGALIVAPGQDGEVLAAFQVPPGSASPPPSTLEVGLGAGLALAARCMDKGRPRDAQDPDPDQRGRALPIGERDS